MIVDKIDNSKIYKNISERIDIAFDYLQKTDFSKMEVGKTEINGDEVYFMVQEYTSKKHEDCKLEAHKKYIDIQYVVSGEELMGICTLGNQQLVENKPEKDVAFYKGEISTVKLTAGMFAVLFPEDLHMPGMMSDTQQNVKKVVVKVMV
jgi:YhcH/YjgK/YiaL family protein